MENQKFVLKGTPEGNLWKIIRNPDTEAECVGHVLIYVDDVMAIAPETVRDGFLGRLKKEWAVSNPETVNETDWVRFCGLEFQWKNDTHLRLAQPSYTKDLLERHGTVVKRSCPMPKVEFPSCAEDDIRSEELKAAQGLTGELLWLAVRSRPDISFAVSLMSRYLSKNPRWVVKVGTAVLEYLASCPTKGLVYGPCEKNRGPEGTLPIVRHVELIEAYADISFAPQGERSSQGIMIFYGGSPIQWEASKQPFCAMSTAEAELLGYCEAMQVVQALEALLVVLHGRDNFEKLLCGDNSSAISILTKPDGPWRTRHLRLRSHGLREKLASQRGDWKLRHQKGTELIADFLTKPITVPGEWKRFSKFLGMESLEDQGLGNDKDSMKTERNNGVPSRQLEGTLRVAKLGLAMAAVHKIVEVYGGSEAAVQLRMLMVILAMAFIAVYGEGGDFSLPRWLRRIEGSTVPSRVDGAGDSSLLNGREEEEPTKAKEQQERQEARGNEPALLVVREDEPTIKRMRFLRENEPRNPVQPREDEPGWTKKERECTHLEVLDVFGKEKEGCSPEASDRPLDLWHSIWDTEFVARPASRLDDDLSSSQDFETDCVKHHCPTGCPGCVLCSVDGGIAMASSVGPSGGLAKIAAFRAESGSDQRSGEIWERELFQRPPRSHYKDCWIDAHLSEGWLVRSHGGSRVRRFHPLHRGVPVDVGLLAGPRVSIGFNEQGQRIEVKDVWTDKPQDLFTPKAPWTGWTFFQLKESIKPALGGQFVEGSGLPLKASYSGESDVPTGASSSAPWTEENGGGLHGTGRDGVDGCEGDRLKKKGRIVANQIPGITKFSRDASDGRPVEERLSDEDEWEKISHSSIVD